MLNSWSHFLSIIGIKEAPVFTFDMLEQYEPAFKKFLFNNEILAEIQFQVDYLCNECEEQCLTEAFPIARQDGKRHWYISCPESGILEINPDRLRHWQIDFLKFSKLISTKIGFRVPPEPTEFGQSIYLGKYLLKSLMIHTYFTPMLLTSDKMKRHRFGAIFIMPASEAIIDDFPGKDSTFYLNDFSFFEDGDICIDKKQLSGLIEAGIKLRDNYPEIPDIKDFRYSPDFHCVNWRGEIFDFNQTQSIIVKALFQAYKNRTPYLGKDYLLELVGKTGHDMKDIFKNNKAWKTLIVGTGGDYKINLPTL